MNILMYEVMKRYITLEGNKPPSNILQECSRFDFLYKGLTFYKSSNENVHNF